MPRRKTRSKRKHLGKRSHGKGRKKRRRGSGSRGGVGNAGLHKHKFSWTVNNEPDRFGAHGFDRKGVKKQIPAINLYDVNRKITTGKIEKKEGKYSFEFRGKILGTGRITAPVAISAVSWSKKAEEKVKKAGGELVKLK